MSSRLTKLLRLVAASLLLCSLATGADEPGSRAEEIQRQRLEKAGRLEPEQPNSVEKAAILVEESKILQSFGQGVDGFLPKLGGLATGQGQSLGLQYSRRGIAAGKVIFTGSAVASFTESRRFTMNVSAPYLARERLAWEFNADRRNLTQVDFYGLGGSSRLEDRTSYLLEDTLINSTLAFKPVDDRFRVGVTGGFLQTNTGSGSRSGTPSTEEMFSPEDVPALDSQPNFLLLGGFATLDLRDQQSLPRSGTLLRAEYTTYRDQDLDLYSFDRVEVEAQQYIPFYNKRRVIVLRARTETNFTDTGQSVPFYLKPWIGGPDELRGFRNYRFYDDNVLVLNAEYRWEAFSGLDMALFFDAGQAAARRQDLSLSKMETAAGFGFRFNIRNATFLRLDVAFSHESTRLWFRWGSPFSRRRR